MNKYCLEKWHNNKSELEKFFVELVDNKKVEQLKYKDLVRAVVKYIYNVGNIVDELFSIENITEIDDGDYQGTLLYLIPYNNYQPDEAHYLMTYVGYGSCSACDTLQGILSGIECGETNKEQTVKDLMMLCKDIVQNTIKPYNFGWRKADAFVELEFIEKD